MTTSKTEICNLALLNIGDSAELANVDTDDTPASRACALVWDSARRRVLADHPWNFALRRFSLPADGAAPEFGFTKSYTLPAAERILRVWTLSPDFHGTAIWEVENGRVLCDETAPLKVRAIVDVLTTATYTPAFVTTLALFIAANIAITLGGARTLRRDLLAEYDAEMRRARVIDGQEQGPRRPTHGSWTLARAT